MCKAGTNEMNHWLFAHMKAKVLRIELILFFFADGRGIFRFQMLMSSFSAPLLSIEALFPG